ncbi:class F sortase [Microbacterium paraoxydans]|uniref:class F sortase n=1 Tax=Microbacterium paraoxydans TaxID=199592 RepID=UPI001CFAF3BD|nr:class F sortase [Microbacterium paraoxydans]
MSGRARRLRVVLGGGIKVAAMGSCLFLTACAPEPVVGTVPARDKISPVESKSPDQSTDVCREGEPVHFVWPDLDVDAAIERVGLDAEGALAPPTSKDTIGWYEPGWKPGSGHGNILIEGHTYTDDSAVFTETFGEDVSKGSRFWFEMDNGSRCEYEVTELFLSIDKDEEFPAVAVEHGFFNATGEERVFGVTCSGEFVGDSHLDVDAFYAEPAW